MKIRDIVLIGSGNLATNLAIALTEAGKNIVCVYSRTLGNAELLAEKCNARFTNRLEDVPTTADLYVIAINDGMIKEVVDKISNYSGIIVHTSGSIPISVFPNSLKQFGVFYPLMMFSKKNIVPFTDIPICLEANDNSTLETLTELASSISNNVSEISSEKRKILHLAAIFACNFTNLNYAIAEDILKSNQLSFNLIKPLIKETAEKIQHNSPSEVQTGPAFREDYDVMHHQLEMLNAMPEYQQMYELLSNIILSIKHKND